MLNLFQHLISYAYGICSGKILKQVQDDKKAGFPRLCLENDAKLTSMHAKPNTFTPVTQRNEVTKSLNNSLRDSSVVALPLNDEIIIYSLFTNYYSLLTNPTFTPENDAMLTCMHAKPNTFTLGGVLC